MKKCLAVLLLVFSLFAISAYAGCHIELYEAGIDTKANLMLSVRSTENTDAFVFMACYDSAGKLTAVSNQAISLQEGYNVIHTSLATNDKDATVKLYIWKNNSLSPLSEIKTYDFKNGALPFGEETIMQWVLQMTDAEKAHLVTGRGMPDSKVNGSAGGTREIPRLNFPVITLADGPAGVRIDPNGGATYGVSYPNGTNLASTWDKDLIQTVGAAIGRDTAAYGIDVILGPGMNILRDPLGGRNFEYFSEDPFLSGHAAAAYVKGTQSEGTAACIKHFAVNNQETARGLVNAVLTERALREIYLTGYEIAIREANPWTVMTTYNQMNGFYNSVNYDLVTGILRDEWGYDGAVFSDWDASGGKAEMVKAQNDLNAPGHNENVGVVLAAIENGTITTEEINQSCANILRLLLRSKVYNNPGYNNQIDFGREELISRQAAADSMVLLKNESNTLPIITSGELAVFGNAQVHTMHSGMGAGDVVVRHNVTIIQGLSSRFPVNDVLVNKYRNCQRNPVGIDQDENPAVDEQELNVSFEEAQAAAARSQYAVITINRSTREGKDHSSSIGDFHLNDKERTMIKNVSRAFHEAGKKVIAVLNVGNPIEIASWRDYCDAIILMGYAGQEGGHALADVMSGSVTPSAKLTQTFPMKYTDTPTRYNYPKSGTAYHREDIYVGYRFYETFDVASAYEFGFGLSYTDFAYSNAKLSSSVFDDTVTVSFDVTNTGKCAGKEVVQVYVTKPDGRLEQPKYVLAGFDKTKNLAPGETEHMEITLTRNELRSYDTENAAWIIEPGEYVISVAASVKDIKATLPLTVEAEQTVQRVKNRCVPKESFFVLNKNNLDALAPSQRVSVATGKSATASATQNPHYGHYAVDGNPKTRWSAYIGATSATEHTLVVDLGKPYMIDGFGIEWEACYVPYNISVSNQPNGPWATVVANGKTGVQSVEFDIPNVEARYVRIAVGVDGFASIYEFNVYEVYTPGLSNIATKKHAFADTEEDIFYAENAIDGNMSTRWSGYVGTVSEPTHTLTVDLRKDYQLARMDLFWEIINGAYTVAYSHAEEGPWTVFYEGKAGTLHVSKSDLDISARYIRIEVPSNQWASLYEIGLYEPIPVGVSNMALQKSATSDTVEGAYYPANAVDGNLSTRWSPGVNNTNEEYHWFRVDLGKEITIDRMHIVWESIDDTYKIEIEKEDGTKTQIEENGKAGDLDVGYANLNVVGRYITVYVPTTRWASIYELEVFEKTEGYPVNISAYKPVTADATQSDYFASYLNDGDSSTRWSGSIGEAREVSAVIDLGECFRVKEISMITESLLGGYELSVATEADGPFKTVLFSNDAVVNQCIGCNLEEIEVYARFIKITCKDASKYASIYEISAQGYPAVGENAWKNLALKKPVTTNADTEANHNMAQAVDGDLTTRWSGINPPHDGSSYRYICVDLGDVQALSECRLFFEYPPIDYIIEVSENGEHWQTVQQVNNVDKDTEAVLSLKGASGRYVRVKLNANNYTSIYEMMIY